jgi:hypothetical protein
MKTAKYFAVCLPVALLVAGVYVLRESVHNSGRFADEGVLAGALLSALALVALRWSIKLYRGMKALDRHLRRR